jgi:hypothetical protein
MLSPRRAHHSWGRSTATSCKSRIRGAVPGSKIQARLFLFAGRVSSDCAPPTEKGRLSADFAEGRRFFGIEICVICGSPWSCGHRRRWKIVKADRTKTPGMRFLSTQHKAIEAEAGVCTTLRANGTACRAEALPKVRKSFEDAHPFLEVRILENAGDSFEDAHLFPRCARKLSIFERRWARSPVSAGSHDLSCTADVPRRLRPLDEFVQML